MGTDLFPRFAEVIRVADPRLIQEDPSLGGALRLASDGPLDVLYAPFDHVNRDARLVLVGITPGRQQALNALLEAHRQLNAGTPLALASERAKGVASFSGPMRANLVAMLDHFGIHKLLGISGCAGLFEASAALVHYTSALRYPVYVDGRNYSGQPEIARTPLLRVQLLGHFAEEAEALRGALFVPLGDKVTRALEFVADAGAIDAERILSGLQHPSGAHQERIAYLLGRKAREALSPKTNADSSDRSAASLRAKIARHAAS